MKRFTAILLSIFTVFALTACQPTPEAAVVVRNFLSGLLPQSFDTEDMIIILLLLLLGNAGKDHNNAFLTLIIYLFL